MEKDNGKENGNYYLGFKVSQNEGYLLGGPYNIRQDQECSQEVH